MHEHRYHPDAARQRNTSDNEPDPEDDGSEMLPVEYCTECDSDGARSEDLDLYPGLCHHCAAAAYDHDYPEYYR